MKKEILYGKGRKNGKSKKLENQNRYG